MSETPMIVLVVTGRTEREILESLKEADESDLVEIRLDYLEDSKFKNPDSKTKLLNSLKRIINSAKKPSIVTLRKKDEGGFFDGKEEDRIEILKKAMEFGADYADIEYSSGREMVKEIMQCRRNAKIIVSYHDPCKTPSEIKNIYGDMKKLDPDMIKIVTHASSITDNFLIYDLVRESAKEGRRITAFCMGEFGQSGRIVSLTLGSNIIYSSAGKGRESAGGQMPLRELIEDYNIKAINRRTKIAGLIGNPVDHSWSHIMHNALFRKFGINAVYLKFKVDKLKAFVEYLRGMNPVGFSVTIPHKIEIMDYLDKIDEKAIRIGAVNTIVIKKGEWSGFNTDCDGAIDALKSRMEIKGKNAVILGAGGSARAITCGLMQEGALVTILSKSVEKAKSLASGFTTEHGPLDEFEKLDYDILINTTPVGMHPDVEGCPVNPAMIRKGKVVFDIVFNPYKTKLLRIAEKKGCLIIPGIEMLINGAALQFELWTGKVPPKDLMREKVLKKVL